MAILNILLYNPLTTLIDQRNEYILDNLTKASDMLATASELTTQYESELAVTKKDAQKEISELQKIQKETFNKELDLSQTYINTLVQKILTNFAEKKENVLTNLAPEIDSLSNQMIKALFMKQA
jgi:F-type H+-transporting ATPase subunit b